MLDFIHNAIAQVHSNHTTPVNMVVLDQYWLCIGSIVMPTFDQNSNASIPYGANIGSVSQCNCLQIGPVLVEYGKTVYGQNIASMKPLYIPV